MKAKITCKHCKGTGEFTRARGDKVSCVSCKGTGIYKSMAIAPSIGDNVLNSKNLELFVSIGGKLHKAKVVK